MLKVCTNLKPHLCKGRWQNEVLTEGLSVKVSFILFLKAIPQSKIKDFCRLPLPEGAVKSVLIFSVFFGFTAINKRPYRYGTAVFVSSVMFS